MLQDPHADFESTPSPATLLLLRERPYIPIRCMVTLVQLLPGLALVGALIALALNHPVGVHPPRHGLVIVDVQNCFLPGGALPVAEGMLQGGFPKVISLRGRTFMFVFVARLSALLVCLPHNREL